MKYYGVIESYQDYKGADATLWGVEKTVEDAQKRLSEAVSEILPYKRSKMDDNDWETFIQENFIDSDHREWYYDDGDCVVKLYIDSVEVEL